MSVEARAKVGLTAVEMFRALEKGQLKAIWIAGTNPAVSLPDLHHVRRAMAKAQLVVVQDAITTGFRRRGLYLVAWRALERAAADAPVEDFRTTAKVLFAMIGRSLSTIC